MSRASRVVTTEAVAAPHRGPVSTASLEHRPPPERRHDAQNASSTSQRDAAGILRGADRSAPRQPPKAGGIGIVIAGGRTVRVGTDVDTDVLARIIDALEKNR